MARKRTQLRAATRAQLHQIVRLEALGKSVDEIAMSNGKTPGEIADLLKHEEYKEIQQRYYDKLYGPVDSALEVRKTSTLLEHAAPDAADALIALIDHDDPVTRRLSATAVLDRTGHGPIQRKAMRVRHELDPASVALLKTAMERTEEGRRQEAEVIDVEAS